MGKLERFAFLQHLRRDRAAIRHRGELMHDNISHTPLRAGDALLVEAKRDSLQSLKQNQGFVMSRNSTCRSCVAAKSFRRC
jgi:hypothetical protein